MRKLILLLALLSAFSAKSEDRVKIAVIDTGVYRTMEKLPFMCKQKQVNFTNTVNFDTHGHGSNIAGIIGESLNTKTHCILPVKFYSQKSSGDVNLENFIKSLQYVIKDIGIRYVNLSMGGPDADIREKNLIKRLLTRGVTVVAAAGNESQNLDSCKKVILPQTVIIRCNKFYPASYRDDFKYPNFFVVKSQAPSSNYGSVVTDSFRGIKVGPKSLPYVPKMTGTSQAAAQKTAQLLKNVVLLYRSINDRTKQTGDRRIRTCR